MNESDHVPLEKETFSFFSYLKEIFEEADCRHIFLDDLLPDSTKSIAAQAFYHGNFIYAKPQYWFWLRRISCTFLKMNRKLRSALVVIDFILFLVRQFLNKNC
jgi:hypothetical protein